MSIVGWGAMAIGACVLAGSVVGALGPVIAPAEARAFRAVNGLPDWLFWPLWVPMQLGNLVVGAGAGLVVAAVLHEWRVAVAVVTAVVLKLVAERVLRHRMARHLSVRQRPGTSQPGAVLRGADGRAHPLRGVTTRIGRSPDNNVVLADAKVSRHHATIIDTGSNFVIADLGSANGVYVRGRRIHPSAVLSDGDDIGIGNQQFTFEATAREPADD